MTNNDVKNGFNEVYNIFWNKYKNISIPKNSPEWDELYICAEELRNKYPFLSQTITELVLEIDERMRKRESSGGRK